MNLNQIIKLRNKGLSVFPVSNETKEPLIKWKRLQDELPTYEEITEWFTPNGRSVGVAMGRVSGMFLLDLDFSRHPEASSWYHDNKQRLPRTWSETTKSNGLHIYFAWRPALDQKKTNTTGGFGDSPFPQGVDTKGQGGFSKITPSEGYQWIVSPDQSPLADPPQWLIDLLPAKNDKWNKLPNGQSATFKNPASWLTEAFEELKEGNRNATFTKIAGSLRSRGYKPDDIFAILKGHTDKLEGGELELMQICQSIGRYPCGTHEEAAAGIESFLADAQVVEWIVPSIIARKTIGFVAGLPETLKTWILIDLAVECARGGGLWLNKFECAPARILFIDQERFKGETQRRFRAVISAKNLQPKDLGGSLFIRCGTSTRIDLPDSFRAFRDELEKIKPDLVLVDSFATFHTKDENHRGDIQEVIERLKQLRNEFGCTFIFIDHENKGVFQDADKDEQPSAFRMVGSIAKPAAAELVLTVRRHPSEGSWVYHTKSTLSSVVPTFLVKVTDVEADRTKIKVEAF